MPVKCLHIKRSSPDPAQATSCLKEFCQLNGIEYRAADSAYEALIWARDYQPELVVACVPLQDATWDSFWHSLSNLSHGSFCVAVYHSKPAAGAVSDAEETMVACNCCDAGAARLISLDEAASPRGAELVVLKRILTAELGREDVLLPEGLVASGDVLEAFACDYHPAVPDRKQELPSLAEIWAKTRASQAGEDKSELPTGDQAWESLDAETLRVRCHQQTELLRYWEQQWDAMTQLLGVGLQVGVAVRHLRKDFDIALSLAEMWCNREDTDISEREIVQELYDRVASSARELVSIDEALRLGSAAPNERVNAFNLLNEIAAQLDDASLGIKLDIRCQGDLSLYDLYGSRCQLGALFLNVLLWCHGNRRIWQQYRQRLDSLSGNELSEAAYMEPVTIQLAVGEQGIMHLHLVDDCGLVWPHELLGTPRLPGPLYTSMSMLWPGTQIPVWGLALARAVLAIYQGRVTVRNAQEGLVLDLELPVGGRLVAQDLPSIWEKEEATRPLARLVFVEDDEKGIRASVLALRNAGYEVIYCENGIQALETVRHNECDALILDLNLPDINGRDLYEKLIKEKPNLNRRAVFVTGYLGTGLFMDAELRQFFESSRCQYLAKPYSGMELVKAVREVLRRRNTKSSLII